MNLDLRTINVCYKFQKIRPNLHKGHLNLHKQDLAETLGDYPSILDTM